MAKNKLELTWVGKEERPRLEPRVLIEDPALSHRAAPGVGGDAPIYDNRLIFGDNLLALKALEQEFAGKVNCVYIDPPFNTGQAFLHYDDGLEHSIWLSLMRDRLEVLRGLVADSGSVFIHIDDNELGYLIALADEVFGRRNRIAVVTFKQSSVSGPKSINPGLVTISNFVVWYAKDRSAWKPNRVFVATQRDRRYTGFVENLEEEYHQWRISTVRKAFALATGIPVRALRSREGLEEELDAFVLKHAERVVQLGRVAPKDINAGAREQLLMSGQEPGVVRRAEREGKDPYYFLNGKQLLFYSAKVQIIDGQRVAGQPASTIWDDLLSNNIHKEGGVDFPDGKKPELLLKRILELSTSPGDLVLDSFAGSGTTGAVAHKMGRRWIMVELGDHAHTHIIPRMRMVVEGSDAWGISEAVKWQGGGGFRYLSLASSLLEKDAWGNWVINPAYDAAMLAEAVCKLEGFTYAPSAEVFWQHGQSTERDFIYITTQTLTHDQLAEISSLVGAERSLLICCGSFKARPRDFANLTVKKIPAAVLDKCDFGRDGYALNEPRSDEPPTHVDPLEPVVDAEADEEPVTV